MPGCPMTSSHGSLAHGTRAARILGAAKTTADLGPYFGHTLYAAEIGYMVEQEWARDADDVLWRRSKCGLRMSVAQREAVAEYMRQRV